MKPDTPVALRHRSKALLAALLGIAMISNSRTVRAEDDPVIQSFAAHVADLEVDSQAKERALEMVQSAAADPRTRPESIALGLAILYPDYAAAVESSHQQDAATAVATLTPFTESDDPFVAADATFVLTRLLMNDERFDEALARLSRLTGPLGEYTTQAGAAHYFAGVAHAGLLDREQAIAELSEFIENYPDAPQRLRDAALRQLEEISAVDAGGLVDVRDHMEFSRRRLQQSQTGQTTQEQQHEIIQMLAKMIRDEEKKECSNSSGKNQQQQQESEAQSQSQQAKNQAQNGKGGASKNPNGEARRTFDDGPASPWSRLRDRSRDGANTALKDKLPARYRSVVEKYYESASGQALPPSASPSEGSDPVPAGDSGTSGDADGSDRR